MTVSDSKPRQTRKAPTALQKRAVPTGRRPTIARYDEDFARWAFEQAAALRQGKLDHLDIENIAEELETLGRGEFKTLRSALVTIVMHMLKWDYQPQRRSRSWAISIRIQRDNAAEQLEENPSLKPRRDEALIAAYKKARLIAADETGLALRTFPVACPYSWQDVTERTFALDDDPA